MTLLAGASRNSTGERARSCLVCLAKSMTSRTPRHHPSSRGASTSSAQSTPTSNTASSSSAQTTPNATPASSSRAHRFWTSDDPLLKALRRRQESYRLRQVGDSARKKADRIEAVSLAKSEIRWVVQHVRKQHPSSKSALDRASRRQLISMAMQMTRHNVPLSYLLGSVPFATLPQELNVRPPILLPRPETEHWATEVVNTLDSLSATQLEKVRIVDLCTGSGCIALLIADALRKRVGVGGSWRVVACDRSQQAVQLAQENAVKLGFSINEAGSNLHIVQADVSDDADMDRLASLAGGAFDLVVSNPPYIPRREWNNLSAEVKEHEDPAALIGERDVASHGSDAVRENGDERKNFLDRHGLAFHERLAQLLYRPTFSTSTPPLPRLVAEYGKGQQKQVERLHAELKAPRDRLPKVVKVERHLVVVGLGNATTHPLTRHSIGQVLLEPLLAGLVEQDRLVRTRLREMRDELEKSRVEAVAVGRALPAWELPVPRSLVVSHGDSELRLDQDPPTQMELTKVSKGKSGGWSSTHTLLIPSSPTFLPRSPSSSEDTIYQVHVSLFKPSHAMNLSGLALQHFLTSQPATSDNVLVLQDELDQPFGEVKRKDTGSARGHNGVRDILARVVREGDRLSRLRIGVGRPEGKGRVDRWVLSKMSAKELRECQEGRVREQVVRQAVGWMRERCTAITDGTGEEREVTSRKDQFGVWRTVWVA